MLLLGCLADYRNEKNIVSFFLVHLDFVCVFVSGYLGILDKYCRAIAQMIW